MSLTVLIIRDERCESKKACKLQIFAQCGQEDSGVQQAERHRSCLHASD